MTARKDCTMGDASYGLDEFALYGAAREFRKRVYRLIRQLPPAERHALDPQMRRAVLSVTNNIAEGHGRWHYQEIPAKVKNTPKSKFAELPRQACSRRRTEGILPDGAEVAPGLRCVLNLRG